jgi:hypothetical protein
MTPDEMKEFLEQEKELRQKRRAGIRKELLGIVGASQYFLPWLFRSLFIQVLVTG